MQNVYHIRRLVSRKRNISLVVVVAIDTVVENVVIEIRILVLITLL